MESLWTLSMPWWQFVLRGGLVYVGLLLMLRAAGKRTFAELTPFDIVALMLVGSSLRSAIVANDTSVLGPFLAVGTMVLIDRLMTWACAASVAVNRWVEGKPVTLAKDGRMLDRVLLAQGVPREGFERELRHHEIDSIEEVAEARLEPNGRISVRRRAGGAEG